VKIPVLVLGVSAIAAVLTFWLIGFPGICGFTGLYGDALSVTMLGFCAALAAITLPILGILVGVLWALMHGFRTTRAGR
jgi:hypothetical protein